MISLKPKIWETYFALQFFKTILFLLLGFYSLYMLIDYSTHAATFHHHLHFSWNDFLKHYACEFVVHFNMLVPFAILIGGIKTLCTLNTHNELVALMASGVSIKTILRPFVVIALLFTVTAYLNTEFLEPIAGKHLKTFSEEKRSHKRGELSQPMVEHLVLADQSTLLFGSYDQVKNRFFDCFWICSADEVYRIKYLYPYHDVPHGEYINHLVRNQAGEIVEKEVFAALDFPEMHFNKEKLIESTILPDELPLTALWAKTPFFRESHSEKEASFITTFYTKMTLPWLCLMALLGPAPYCIIFSRSKSIFLIYASATFALIACYLVIEAAEVVSKRQFLHPLFAITIPFLTAFCFVTWKTTKLR